MLRKKKTQPDAGRMESSTRSMIMLKTLQKHWAHLIRKSRGSDRKEDACSENSKFKFSHANLPVHRK